MLSLKGVIRLQSPLHVSDPQAARFDFRTGKYVFGPQGTAITRTVHQRVVTGNRPAEDGSSVARIARHPYLPANGLRGRLRRAAATIIFDKFRGAGMTVTRNCYMGMVSGAVTGNPEGDKTVSELQAAAENAFVGMFGGGPRLLESGYRVHDLVPIIDDYLAIGAIPSEFAGEKVSPGRVDDESGEAYSARLTYPFHIIRRDDLRQFSDPKAPEIVADYEKIMIEEQGAALASRASKKAKKDGEAGETDQAEGPRGVRNIVMVEAVAPGTPMYFELRIREHMKEQHVGLVLEALAGLFNQQALGGWSRAGFGRYSATIGLYDGAQRLAPALELVEGLYTPADNDAVRPYTDALHTFLETLTPTDLEQFYSLKAVKNATA